MGKLIHLTDTHVLADGGMLAGVNTYVRTQGAVASICREHADADVCVVSGDLVENGTLAEYEAFRRAIEPLPMPVKLMLGNHDSRSVFRESFPEAPVDGAGFVQHDMTIDAGRTSLIFLDTHEPGQGYGMFCSARQAWLRERLKTHRACDAVLLFMHHHPIPLGLAGADGFMLRDHAALAEVMREASNIRLICFGHAHRPVAGCWAGVPVAASRSLGVQLALDLVSTSGLTLCHEPPAYGVVLTRARDVVYHLHEYADASPRTRV